MFLGMFPGMLGFPVVCQPARSMSPVHENDGVGFAGHVFANPVEVQLHGLGVGCWQNQRGACAPLRTNGPEQTGVLITLTGGSAWSRPLAGPDAAGRFFCPIRASSWNRTSTGVSAGRPAPCAASVLATFF